LDLTPRYFDPDKKEMQREGQYKVFSRQVNIDLVPCIDIGNKMCIVSGFGPDCKTYISFRLN
jgi:predicted metal-binding protein